MIVGYLNKDVPANKIFSKQRKHFLHKKTLFLNERNLFCACLKDPIFCLKNNLLYLLEKPDLHTPKISKKNKLFKLK